MTCLPPGSNATGALPTSTKARPSILIMPSFIVLTCSSELFATGDEARSSRSLLPELRMVK